MVELDFEDVGYSVEGGKLENSEQSENQKQPKTNPQLFLFFEHVSLSSDSNS